MSQQDKMSQQDSADSEKQSIENLKGQPLAKRLSSPATGSSVSVEVVLSVNSTVRRLIVDYVLAAAIIGIAPIYFNKWIDIAGFVALILLNIKLVLEIRKRWGSPQWQGKVSIISIIFGFVEAFVIAVVARLAISAVGLFFPVLVAFNSAVGHAVFTWLVGRAANHFYFGTIRSHQVEVLAVHNASSLQK